MPSSVTSGKPGTSRKTRRGRASSSDSDGGKRSPKRSAKRFTGNLKTSSAGSTKSFFLPLLAVWVLALVVLSGLIYWGAGSRSLLSKTRQRFHSAPASQQVPIPEPKKQTASMAIPEPKAVQANQNNQGAAPVGRPILERRETFTSRDIPQPDPADSSPSDRNNLLAHNSNAVQPGIPTGAPHHPGPVLTPPVARVAIVIDDFGQDMEMAKKFLAVPLPLTFSILPYLRHSQDIAQLAHSHHHEVMLHLPMEPVGYPKTNPGGGALLLSMSSDGVQKALQTAIDSTPYISGINNHMGSRFTEDAASMKIVLTELHHRGLFFLDSSTSPKSVGYSLAQQLEIPSRKRDIFLDHNLSEDFIRSQLEQLIRKAKIEGVAIAIGHPHETTLRVLLQAAERFEQEKIAVVPSGQLMTNTARAAKD